MGVNISGTSNKSSKVTVRQDNKTLARGFENGLYRCSACRGFVNATEAVVIRWDAYHPRHAPKEAA